MKQKILILLIMLCSIMMVSCRKADNVNENDISSAKTEINEVVEKETIAYENINDFSAKLDIQNNVQELNNIIDIDNGNICYKLSFNHQEEIYEINFFKTASKDDISLEKREYIGTYYNYMPMDSVYLLYNGNDDENIIISFSTKGNQIFEYIINKDKQLEQIENQGNTIVIGK